MWQSIQVALLVMLLWGFVGMVGTCKMPVLSLERKTCVLMFMLSFCADVLDSLPSLLNLIDINVPYFELLVLGLTTIGSELYPELQNSSISLLSFHYYRVKSMNSQQETTPCSQDQIVTKCLYNSRCPRWNFDSIEVNGRTPISIKWTIPLQSWLNSKY